MHGVAKLHEKRRVNAADATVAETWAALERRVPQVAPFMNAQNVSNAAWAYATLGVSPGAEAWAALERRVPQVALDMTPQNTCNTVWAYAKLNISPGAEALAALDRAAAHLAPDMNSQQVANMVWGLAILSILRGVQFPVSHAAVWDRVASSMDARDFTDEGLCQLFHAHLMHQRLSPPGSIPAASSLNMPAWVMVEARDMWMRSVRNCLTTDSHMQLADVIGELGVRHEVERLTDDGYFSMDIYLPDHDVAVEYDGPFHYYYHSSSDATSDARRLDLSSPTSWSTSM